MSFQDMIDQARKDKLNQQKIDNNRFDSLLAAVPNCIKDAAQKYYTECAKTLASSIVNSGNKSVRVRFPERILFVPKIIYDWKSDRSLPPNFVWGDLNINYEDQEMPAFLILIDMKSNTGPFALTEYGHKFFSEVCEHAKRDCIMVTDIICLRESWYSVYQKEPERKEFSISSARPHKDHVFKLTNWTDHFSFLLSFSCK